MRRALIAGALALGVFIFWAILAPSPSARAHNALELHAPPFAEVAHASAALTATNFLDDEAGISAYFQFTQTVNLNGNQLRNLFRTIETDQPNYLIGFVPVPGFSETDDVKVFIHKDGWVVAYYLRFDPASKIFAGVGETTTRLETILAEVASAIQVASYTTNFYDFRHPDANRLLLIGETRGSPSGTDTFNTNLPGTFTYYERSWYLKSNWPDGRFTLDGIIIGWVNGGDSTQGYISDLQMVTDAPHTIGVYNSLTYFNDVFGGLALVYREP